jgi:hypothetical protein
MHHITRAALAIAFLFAASFSAVAGCSTNRASGERMCVYSGSETGWQAAARFGTVNGEPVLVITSDADTWRVDATEIVLREEGGAPERLPVRSGTSASNCFWGVLLIGSCMPTTTAVVTLDRANLEKLAARKATYVAVAKGATIGPSVKIKGRQARAWLDLYDQAHPRAVAAQAAAL